MLEPPFAFSTCTTCGKRHWENIYIYIYWPDATIARAFTRITRPGRPERNYELGQGQQVAAPPASLPLQARKLPRFVGGIFRREAPTTEMQEGREERTCVRVCKGAGPARAQALRLRLRLDPNGECSSPRLLIS